MLVMLVIVTGSPLLRFRLLVNVRFSESVSYLPREIAVAATETCSVAAEQEMCYAVAAEREMCYAVGLLRFSESVCAAGVFCCAEPRRHRRHPRGAEVGVWIGC